MRVLFTVHAGRSHLRLVVPLAQEAQRAGHAVAVASTESMRTDIERYGLEFFEAGMEWGEDRESVIALLPAVMEGDRQAYDHALVHTSALGKPALRMARDTLEIAREWRPDIIVREGEDFGGYLAAEVLGLPHVAVAGGSTYLLRPEVVHEPLNRLRAELGLPPADERSAYRHLLASWLPRRYLRDDLDSRTLRHYQQIIPFHGDDVMPRWFAELPPDRPFVFASFGTTGSSLPWCTDRALEVIVAAAGRLDCSAVVSVGLDRPLSDFSGVADNVLLINEWVPQAALLEACDLFINHGGHSSIREGLRAGVPMLIMPMYDDQWHTAQRCHELGVALSLLAEDVSPDSVLHTATRLLTEPSFRYRSQAFQREILTAEPVSVLVDDLQRIVEHSRV